MLPLWFWLLVTLAVMLTGTFVTLWCMETPNHGTVLPGIIPAVSFAVNEPWATASEKRVYDVGTRVLRNGERNRAHNGVFVLQSDRTWTRSEELANPEQATLGNMVHVDHEAAWYVLVDTFRFTPLSRMVMGAPPRTDHQVVWTDRGWRPLPRARAELNPADIWDMKPHGLHVHVIEFNQLSVGPTNLWVAYIWAQHEQSGLYGYRLEIITSGCNEPCRATVTDTLSLHGKAHKAKDSFRLQILDDTRWEVQDGQQWPQVVVSVENCDDRHVHCGMRLVPA
jgi:hypothetical protein